jgi:hypothetical protein
MMDKIFQRLLENNFSDLKGMTADVSIPVPEYLINEIIAAALQGNKNIDACRLSIHAENKVTARLRTTLLPISLNLRLKLDNRVDFASYSSPKVRAWLENNLLLGKLGAFFNVLPEGIKLYGNQLVVDLSSFLQTPEQRRMLELVESIDISTAENRIIFSVKIEVDWHRQSES